MDFKIIFYKEGDLFRNLVAPFGGCSVTDGNIDDLTGGPLKCPASNSKARYVVDGFRNETSASEHSV
jgi:hypothetical protein